MGFLENVAPKIPPPPPVTGPRVAPSEPYAAAALRDELEILAGVGSGQRNAQLNESALKLARLPIDRDDLRDQLIHACDVNGLNADDGPSHTEATIRSAFGKADLDGPRAIPERQAVPHVLSRTQESHPAGPWGNFAPIDGAEWMFSPDIAVTELWGSGDDILWADGEALMICGPPGLGKSTLAGQLVRAQLGLQSAVLDMPVIPVDRPILYLAMDRPAQIRRSMKRQFGPEERDLIAGRLLVRPGPPIMDMAVDPTLLARMADAVGAGVVYVDSLKDAVVGLSGDEAGAMYNRARQSLLADGVNICELHHLRKPSVDSAGGISSIYGSTWLASGAGSVIILSGEPGDLVVRFRHVKTPSNEVGPLRLILNPDTGDFTVQRCDLLVSAKNAGTDGLTAEGAAKDLYDVGRPTASEKKKAERQLMRLTSLGKLIRTEGLHGPVWFPRGDIGGTQQAPVDSGRPSGSLLHDNPQRAGTIF